MSEARKIIEELKTQYKGDSDALELIEGAEVDITYLEKREREEGYKGQTAAGKANEIKNMLHDWY